MAFPEVYEILSRCGVKEVGHIYRVRPDDSPGHPWGVLHVRTLVWMDDSVVEHSTLLDVKQLRTGKADPDTILHFHENLNLVALLNSIDIGDDDGR